MNDDAILHLAMDISAALCVECRQMRPMGHSVGRHQGCHARLVGDWRDTGTWGS